jgi:hypothetical protein
MIHYSNESRLARQRASTHHTATAATWMRSGATTVRIISPETIISTRASATCATTSALRARCRSGASLADRPPLSAVALGLPTYRTPRPPSIPATVGRSVTARDVGVEIVVIDRGHSWITWRGCWHSLALVLGGRPLSEDDALPAIALRSADMEGTDTGGACHSHLPGGVSLRRRGSSLL